jgi:hypothetical protein
MIGKQEILVTDNSYLKGMPVKQTLYAGAGAIAGYIESWVNPTFPLALCSHFSDIRKSGKADLSLLIQLGAETAGYAFGMSNHVRDIMANPNEFMSYVPLLTNFIGLSVAEVMAFKKGRKLENELQ